jgi:hypothetical protein
MASEIKVDNIKDQCGTAVITKCGATHTVTAEVYKANTIKDTSDNTYLAKCGSTVTLGGCGQTITLAAGASQTGFGRTGTVNWDTTAKTTGFTAVSGTGYFCDTSGGPFSVTLPVGSAGAIVSVADYTRTFQTNTLTIYPNGSEKIGGIAGETNLTTEGQSVTLIYVDSTEGWINVQDSTSALQGRLVTPYIIATGGTVTCCGDYKIHTFTGPGTFTVSNEGTPAGSDTFDYLVLAGGGGGGANGGGGGGGGGHRTNYPSGCAGLPATFGSIPITVGAGGSGAPNSGGTSAPSGPRGSNGSNSSFSSITSAGGGGAGNGHAAVPSDPCGPWTGAPGGSGGGGGSEQSPANPGPVHASGVTVNGGGGGGGGASGSTGGGGSPTNAGNGGPGTSNSITGSPTTRSGGGGGGAYATTGSGGSGGSGGGGAGSNSGNGASGSSNAGGGAGGGKYGIPSPAGAGGNGGSGLVIIRYKYQN